MDDFEEMYKDRDDKYVCLMDMALMAMKRLKKDGILDNMEESDEINACSIVVPVEIDGKEEEWLIPLTSGQFCAFAIPLMVFSVLYRKCGLICA